MSKKIKAYALRLDPEMKIKAEKQARSERRSLNSWILVAIEERLNKTKPEEEKAA